MPRGNCHFRSIRQRSCSNLPIGFCCCWNFLPAAERMPLIEDDEDETLEVRVAVAAVDDVKEAALVLVAAAAGRRPWLW